MLKIKTQVTVFIALFSINAVSAQETGTMIEINVPTQQSYFHSSRLHSLTTTHRPVLTAPQQSVPLAFKVVPGVISEPVFGGVDHPRFSIRGSGLQRGTQPAGRGIELRVNGLPINYADTSYDFVEWLDPSDYHRFDVVRGGRAASTASVTLGGVVDFISPAIPTGTAGSLRYQSGRFGKEQRQISLSHGGESIATSISASQYQQSGFREHNQQKADRLMVSTAWQMTDTKQITLNALSSDSELQLPGPQTLASINQRSRIAQPGNVVGNWRRNAKIQQIQLGMIDQGNDWSAQLGIVNRDILFVRRDIQDERSRGASFSLSKSQAIGSKTKLNHLVLAQYDERNIAQFFNGGGTPPTFTGQAGNQWADNKLTASRLSAQTGLNHEIDPAWMVYSHLSIHRHDRRIEDNFKTANRSPAAGNQSFLSLSGIAGTEFKISPDVMLFSSISHVTEPPTFDVLLTHIAGMPNFSTNPRRPQINQLDDQKMLTIEGGFRWTRHQSLAELTLYHAWLRNEIVTVTDANTAQVTQVGNAKRTNRLGAELLIDWQLAQSLFRNNDEIRGLVNWNWVQAAFDDDDNFHDNKLPVVTPHTIYSELSYRPVSYLKVAANLQHVPRGAYVDYANSFRDDGYSVFGARIEWDHKSWRAFVDASNLNNVKYAATVIGAQNNASSTDGLFFAPGEPRSLTVGVGYEF